MVNELTIPVLPCRDLDESIPFYEALGFERTYRQDRPNPYAVVAREDIHIHLFAMDGFDPEQSYGSVIMSVPDPDELYRVFAAGLRSDYWRLPSAETSRSARDCATSSSGGQGLAEACVGASVRAGAAPRLRSPRLPREAGPTRS
jgi:catechol 2,3-dioxygenase-like lactoylglutathione lyase family enzyme